MAWITSILPKEWILYDLPFLIVVHYNSYPYYQCYLRLASPHHAHTLVNYFSSKQVVQSSGLDDIGSPPTGKQHLTMELVQGKKEELYWEKVPEKVRRQAVQKAVSMQQQMHQGLEVAQTKKRKRKRDK